MSNRFNIGNMKIDHRSRKSRMPEPLLYMHYVLSVLQEMSGCTVPKVVYRDGMVECDPCKGVLENDTHIAWSDALWLSVTAMTLEDIVIAWILLPECAQHHKHLVRDGHVAVFTSLALEYEQLLAVKADVVPSETACLADPKGTVIDDGKHGFVIKWTVAQKSGNLLLGKHPWQPLRLTHLWKHESARLLKPHHLVVCLQSEHRVLEERQAATVLLQECRQIVVDVCLCELLRQLLEKQHCLSNLQAIVIDTAVCILCQTQLFSEKRNAVTEFGYSRQPTNEARTESNLFELCLARRRKTKSAALSNVVLVIFFVVEGINDGEVRIIPSSPFTF